VAWLLIAASLRAAPAAGADQPDTYRAVDDYVHTQMAAYGIPGAALGIVQDDRVAYLKGYGLADPVGRRVTPQTPFLLASVTKSFTALCIMQLVEEGAMTLDAPVRTYLPWFRAADADASSRITVRHLLNQASGFSELDGRRPFLNADDDPDALESYVRSLSEATLIFAPGQRFEYSNANYNILGVIVQEVSGLSYETYVGTHVFQPLDMRHTHTSPAAARADRASDGHYPYFGIPVASDTVPSRATVSAAGIYSTAEDMAHYLIAQLNGGRYGDRAVISANGMAEMHKPAVRLNSVAHYGMGWIVGHYYDIFDNAIRHDGAGPRFHSFALVVPERRFGIVWLINIDYPPTGSAFNSIGWGIAEAYLGRTPPRPQTYEPLQLQYVRGLLAAILILLGGGALWSLRWLRRWRRDGPGGGQGKRALRAVLVPAAIDLALALYVLAVFLPQNAVTVPIALYFVPDVGLLLIGILVMTLGWGLLRTVLMLRAVFSPRTGGVVVPGDRGS
jgi:CubicO group peptidase (beta-lactamase class C family)